MTLRGRHCLALQTVGRQTVILGSLALAVACGRTRSDGDPAPDGGAGGAGARVVPTGTCETNSDCFCERCHCCGCTVTLVCEEGRCVEGPEICSDSSCCGSAFGCGPNCEIITPYTDYDGTCGGIACSVAHLDLAAFRKIEYAELGCCTTADEGLSSAPDRCGVDLAVFVLGAEPGTCVELERPGVLDPSCPDSEPDPAVSSPLPGCCMPNGTCGVLTGQGLGCTYPDFATSTGSCDASAAAGASGSGD